MQPNERMMRLTPIAVVAFVMACSTTALPPATSVPPAAGTPAYETFTIQSKVLGEKRRINVYASPGYSAARDLVLYMPDGGIEEDFPHVSADVDAAVRAGEMRPALVVGIENTQRRRDMTGPTSVESDRKIAPHVGGSANFRAFLRDELMPAVRQHYRSRGPTAIIGESLAGLFVVETFLTDPQMFGTWIALSPSLWWNNEALVRDAGDRLKKDSRMQAVFYFATAGDDGIDDAAKTLAAALGGSGAKGLTWFYEPRPDLKHSTIYRGASPAVLRKLFPPVPSSS